METSDTRIGAYEIAGRPPGDPTAYLARRPTAAGRGRLYQLHVLPIAADGSARELEREVELCKAISHPAIPPVVELFRWEQSQVVVFEHVDGIRLSRLLPHLDRDGERLSDGAIWYLGLQAVGALARAHAATDAQGNPAPIVHGRLAPHQLLIAWDGRVLLMGLGLPTLLAAEAKSASLDGALLGFAAPELRAGSKLTPAADAYAAALMLWSLLTGRTPPSGSERIPLLSEVRRDVPESLAAAIDLSLEPSLGLRRMRCVDLERELRRAANVAVGKAELRDCVEITRALLGLWSVAPPPVEPKAPASPPPPIALPPPALGPPRPPGAPAPSSRPPAAIAPPALPRSAPPPAPPSPSPTPAAARARTPTPLPSAQAPAAATKRPTPAPVAAPPAAAPKPPAPSPTPPESAPAPRAADPPPLPVASEAAAKPVEQPPARADIVAQSAEPAHALPAPEAPSLPTTAVDTPSPVEREPTGAVPPPTAPAPARAARRRSRALTPTLALALAAVAGAWVAWDAGLIGSPPAIPAAASSSARAGDSPRASASAHPDATAAPLGATPSAALDAGPPSAATSSAEPLSSPGEPPRGSLPEVAPAPGDGSELLSYEGYLLVRSPANAEVFVQGKQLGPTNKWLVSRCHQKFVRIAELPGPTWLSAGVGVSIGCRAKTEVTIEPDR